MFLFLLFLFIFYVFYRNKEKFINTSNIIFINKNDLTNILIQDNDNYYKTFNKNDMIVRNIKHINDYYEIIKNSTIDCNNKIKDKIIKCIFKVEEKFKNINLDYMDGKKFNNITWKFGFIKDKLYEGGLPHTRNDNIILPFDYLESIDENSLIKLLIHEKIHVYQKLYHDDIEKYLIKNNFNIVNKIITNRRANPDMDNKIYKDKNNNAYYAQYNNKPKDIMDVTYYPINNSLHEHPFEKMAYELSNY
jgi:hypothetical protein